MIVKVQDTVDLLDIQPATDVEYDKLSQNEMFDLLQFSIFQATTGKINRKKFLKVIEQIIAYLQAKNSLI